MNKFHGRHVPYNTECTFSTSLGGTHSYDIDRRAGLEVQKALPDIKPLVVENRSFLRRAVRWLTKSGVTQFIDIGSGLPTAGSTHETALKVNLNVTVLYVDIEETVVREGIEIIKQTGLSDRVGLIKANALEPKSVFEHLETQRLVDFKKPVAIMMLALTHFWTPQEYQSVLGFWKKELVLGSAFVMTHSTTDDRDSESLKQTQKVYAQAKLPLIFRPRAEILPVMDGWQLVSPGLVRPHQWKMEELEAEEEEPPTTKMWWVAVGKLL